jgi:putative FmdB family regulatory protein
MPIFDFVCKECSKEFEKLVRPADIPPECPDCGSKNTEKRAVPTQINFSLGGIGIYKNNTQ